MKSIKTIIEDLRADRTAIGPASAAGAGLALLALVAALDWLTGPELDFSLFYLIPVCVVTWFAGTRVGYATCVISAATWLCVDRLTGAKSARPLVVEWNFAVRILFFCGSVLLLEAWKDWERRLSLLVNQRTRALRDLANQLSASEDAERRQLAYDMHDALSQSLSLIKMNLDAAQLEAPEQSSMQTRIANCGEMIDEVIKQTRTLMFDLHPAMLDDLGLVPTLMWYAKEFEQRTKAELFVTEHGERILLSVAIRNYLFRAMKELFANAAKHGQAREVIVAIHWELSRLRVVIDDDGSGFDVNVVQTRSARHGLGLPGIRERVSSIGGTLSIESTPGQGTRVMIELPVGAASTSIEEPLASKESFNALASSAR